MVGNWRKKRKPTALEKDVIFFTSRSVA